MKRRRRLLIAAQPKDGGVVRHVLDLVDAIPRDCYEVDVACPRSSLTWRALEGRSDVRLTPIAPYRRPFPPDLVSLARLIRLVGEADVVHVHSAKAGAIGRMAAAFRGRRSRCIFSPHAWSFWAVHGPEASVYRNFERMAAHWCERFVVVSRHEEAAGLEAGVGRPEQYRVIRNGVRLERFDQPPAPVRGRLLLVTRFAAQKRTDIVLEALRLLAPRFPEVELDIVGDGPDRERLERLALDLGLSTRVRFLGARDDVPELLAHSHCALLASRYEGAPLAVLEAMAAAVPVVATAVGGVPEMVDDGRTGILVEPDSAAAFAAGVERLLIAPEKARALGETARQRARERFSLERMIRELLALYNEVASAADP